MIDMWGYFKEDGTLEVSNEAYSAEGNEKVSAVVYCPLTAFNKPCGRHCAIFREGYKRDAYGTLYHEVVLCNGTTIDIFEDEREPKEIK